MARHWQHSDSFHMGGIFTLTATDRRTGLVVARLTAPNVITTAAKILVANMVAEQVGYDTGITYAEIGTGTTAPAVTDTALVAATKRNAITTVLIGDNIAQFRTYYTAASSTIIIGEVGLFAHSTATATIGTGTLFARGLISLDNSAGLLDLTISYTLTFG